MSNQGCNCAICGSFLHDQVDIGSRQQSALRRRRELVRRRREGLPPTDGDESANEPFDDEPRDWNEHEENTSYDPDLVSEESLEWLASVACVGYNLDAPGESRCFLSETEPYEADCELILRPGVGLALIRAENQPEETEVYWQSATQHDAQVDPDLLYDIMAGLSESDLCRLDINYGPVSYEGSCPADATDFYNHLHEVLASGSFQTSSEIPLLRPASPDEDPFCKLSGELICEIARMVPYDTLMSLRSASRTFYNHTQSHGFRKSRITVDMPWFWDFETSLKTRAYQIDYKKLYAWLEVVTRPKFGMEGYLLAIANRRRIWQCCREILSHSQDVMGLEYATVPDPQIVAKAQRSILFKVAPTQASPQDNISQTFWLHSEKELQASRFGTLLVETYWNEDDLLSGVGVVVGNSPRFFGARSGRVERARLVPGDWITEMELKFGGNRSAAGKPIIGIKGITFHLRLGEEFRLGETSFRGDYRLLYVSEGKGLVGVEGQIRSDGVISRIGILEAPISEQNPPSHLKSPDPLAQRTFWAGDDSTPICYRPDIKITPVFPPRLPEEFLEDSITPYHTLLWVNEQRDLGRPLRVVAYTPLDPTDPTQRLVLGLQVEFVQGRGEAKRYIGHGGDWPEDETTNFDLYYPLDERIVEIGVSKSGTLEGIMLKTDWLRSVIFGQGEPEPENWTMVRVPDGDFINGIAVTFETDPTTGSGIIVSSRRGLFWSVVGITCLYQPSVPVEEDYPAQFALLLLLGGTVELAEVHEDVAESLSKIGFRN
ncbi:hypothetical protein CEP51_009347 [Fusarium floridanum]|uniref:F-box domain-containing protein n=1 Tax=Fusarium floridanum TaxID=1325733 RepID=A0A428RHX7_9HYPO|nr:hypothetical protein CEP51_009347 [Fusarium floridanum]